jgi:hypothetical protein
VRCSFSQEKAEIVCGLVKWFLSVRRWGWESWERTRRRERKAGRARWSSRAFW